MPPEAEAPGGRTAVSGYCVGEYPPEENLFLGLSL